MPRAPGALAWLYVTSEIGGQVSKLEIVTHKLVHTAPVQAPSAKPKGVLVSRDQQTLYTRFSDL